MKVYQTNNAEQAGHTDKGFGVMFTEHRKEQIQNLKTIVCLRLDIPVAMMEAKTRIEKCAAARMLVVYLAFNNLGMDMWESAAIFGTGNTHTSKVCRAVKDKLSTNKKFRELVREIKELL